MPVQTFFNTAYVACLLAWVLAFGGPSAVAQEQLDDLPPVPPIGADAYNKTAIINVEAGQSYVRLANFGAESTRNYVEIFGLADRVTLGSFVVDVPAKATVQFQPELMIHTFAPVNWDQPIALYVENGRSSQLWQHIKLQPRTGPWKTPAFAPRRRTWITCRRGKSCSMSMPGISAASRRR